MLNDRYLNLGAYYTMKSQKTLTRKEILAILHRHQYELKQFKVKRMGLFGSFAKGKPTSKSDIDFLVEFDEPTYENFYNLIEYLEDLLGRKVEVLTPDAVDSIRVEEVARDIRESIVYV